MVIADAGFPTKFAQGAADHLFMRDLADECMARFFPVLFQDVVSF
jgi:hypothetical protein